MTILYILSIIDEMAPALGVPTLLVNPKCVTMLVFSPNSAEAKAQADEYASEHGWPVDGVEREPRRLAA